MRSSKSNPPLPPPLPPYTAFRNEAERRAAVAQERTPLLSSNPNRIPNPALPTYTHSPYTYPPPPPPKPSFIQHPDNHSYQQRGDPHVGSELQARKYFTHPRWMYRPTLRRDTSNTLSHRICRHILLTLLFLTIITILFRNYILFLDFNPPGLVLPPEKEEMVRVAVIGAGPGGVGAALRLSELFPVMIDGKGKERKEVEVVVFEKSSSVGGRMSLNSGLELGEGKEVWNGQRVGIEDVASSSLFSQPSSLIRRRAEAILGLSFSPETATKAENVEEMSEKVSEVGFYDGNSITIRTTRPYSKMSWLQWGKLVLKYRTSFLSAHSLPTDDVKRFTDMLRLVETETFDGVEDWVKRAGLKESVEMGARDKLKDAGVGDGYRDEVVESQVRRQLDQGTEEISALALSLALSREEISSNRATNGIKMEDVFEQLLAKSGAEVRLGTTLESMKQKRVPGKKGPVWNLSFNNGHSEIFDKVILTAPFTPLEKAHYRPIWQTFILSSTPLQASHFKISKTDGLPSQILPIPDSYLMTEMKGMHEISYIKDIFGPDIDPSSSSFTTKSVFKLYKMLSSTPVSEELIKDIWGEGVMRVMAQKVDDAYPLLFPRSEGLGKFKVEGMERVWSTSVVESVGWSVDLSWAAGENVANLIKKDMG